MTQKGLTDWYAILETSENADEATIKKAYRKLVLQWHPDKTPNDRERAEERIRQINAAYATLSNPVKREKYDLQRCAMEGKRHGKKPGKPKASPKVMAPKEFMLQPLGHPEKFLRYTESDKKVHAQNREDVFVAYEDFFKLTKLSLWWVPEVNNMCRIRALGVKARGDKRVAVAGIAGGLNFSFRVKEGFESEVRLAAAPKGKRADNVNFIMKSSPEYEGAYRFEVVSLRGYYLSYYPPSDVRIASLLDEDEGKVLDFMLTDFNASLHYKDLEEVLCLAAAPNRNLWVQLEDLVAAPEIKEYFEKVLQKPVWDLEDFVAHVQGHWQDWEFDADTKRVRLRPLPERISELLAHSNDELETVEALRKASEELKDISVKGAVRATTLIAQERDFAEAPKRTHADQQLKLLRVLPEVLESAKSKPERLPTPRLLLDASEKVPGLVGERPMPADLAKGKSAMCIFTTLIAEKLQSAEKMEWADSDFGAEDVLRLLQQPEIASFDGGLKDACAAALANAEQNLLLQVVRKAVTLGCFAIADAATSCALARLNHLDADAGGGLLKELSEAGAMPDKVASLLRSRATFFSADVMANAFLALYDRNLRQDVLKSLQDGLAAKAPFLSLDTELLQKLALACTKHSDVLSPLTKLVVEAVSLPETPCACGDMIKLLLAFSTLGSSLDEATRKSFLDKAQSVLGKLLPTFALADLVKVVLPASAFGPSELMTNAAGEVAIRFEDFALTQLLLVTQALLRGLPPDHREMAKVIQHWSWKLRAGQQNATTVVCSDIFTQTSGQLSVTQLAKLVAGMIPVLKACSDATLRQKFAEEAGAHLLQHAQEVPSLYAVQLVPELRPGGTLAHARGEKVAHALQAANTASGMKRKDSVAGLQLGKNKKRRR
mmetsp:Transcript_15432/g.35232  ORF Transcript_15432/g.35232 Transcript_15432/m.35232 type:complete len:891 (+) Transcript_15432:87-2759(+)